MQSIIFGGSFDPIHNGHLKMANSILEQKLADEIIFLPTKIQPLKINKNVTPANLRLEMLEIALKSNENFKICTHEIEKKSTSPSYSFQTMRELKIKYPQKKIIFLMGIDSLNEIHLWENFIEFIEENEFMIYPRPQQNIPTYAELIRKIGSKTLTKKLLSNIIELPLSPISSTEVREKIAIGKNFATLIPAEVFKFILRKKLYQNEM